MSLRWYADNSELVGTRGAQIQDILIFGGVVIDISDEAALRKNIECTKERYGHRRAPVKWNFKDLKPYYEKEDLSRLFNDLLSRAQEWRKEILVRALEEKFTIFVSCIEAHSLERKIIKLRKRSLSQYVFANTLMRVGLYAKQCRTNHCEVFLDWPDKDDPKPFNREYAAAFKEGKTLDGHVSYHSGALKDLGFADSPVYATMNHCTLLQLSDLVLGATREFIEYAICKRQEGLGIEMTRLLKGRFYGAPETISGRGINVSSGNSDFRQKIREAISRELC